MEGVLTVDQTMITMRLRFQAPWGFEMASMSPIPPPMHTLIPDGRPAHRPFRFGGSSPVADRQFVPQVLPRPQTDTRKSAIPTQKKAVGPTWDSHPPSIQAEALPAPHWPDSIAATANERTARSIAPRGHRRAITSIDPQRVRSWRGAQDPRYRQGHRPAAVVAQASLAGAPSPRRRAGSPACVPRP